MRYVLILFRAIDHVCSSHWFQFILTLVVGVVTYVTVLEGNSDVSFYRPLPLWAIGVAMASAAMLGCKYLLAVPFGEKDPDLKHEKLERMKVSILVGLAYIGYYLCVLFFDLTITQKHVVFLAYVGTGVALWTLCSVFWAEFIHDYS